MGRTTVLFGFWLVGYVLGFFVWMIRAPVVNWVMTRGISSDVAGALITGFASSVAMLAGVLVWSFMSSQ